MVMVYYATRGGSFRNPLDWVFDLAMRVPGILIGVSVHEFAHAKMADALGDPTPRMQGRVTLNPARHFDLIGLISLVIIGFGWGKPVMISPRNFQNIRRDSFLVSVAGVATNFVVAALFSGIYEYFWMRAYASAFWASSFGGNLMIILQNVIWLNLVLMIFNLLPVPPLDGFNMLTEIFNLRRYGFWYSLYNHGFPILMVLILLGVTGRIMTPALSAIFPALLRLWYPLLSVLM
jgi:Zn-dependent protease